MKKSVRAALVFILEQAGLGLPIYGTRYVEAIELTEFIAVYFGSGEVDAGGLGASSYMADADINITIFIKGDIDSDDRLDDLAALVLAALKDPVNEHFDYLQYQGWEYGDAESSVLPSLTLKYKVSFFEN